MTLVIVLQLLLASLVGLLLLERRLSDTSALSDDDPTLAVEFHPELIVRWDDESVATPSSFCSRRVVSDHRTRARAESPALRPRSYTH